MTKEYILSDITCKMGRLNGDYIYDLTFVDISTLEIYMCVVDTQYRNWNKWQHIIDNNVLGSYSNLKRRNQVNREGIKIIDADSTPQLVMMLTETEICDVIEYQQQHLKL